MPRAEGPIEEVKDCEMIARAFSPPSFQEHSPGPSAQAEICRAVGACFAVGVYPAAALKKSPFFLKISSAGIELTVTSHNNDRITTGSTGKHEDNKQSIEQNKKKERTDCAN
jgi:hypothetical protein